MYHISIISSSIRTDRKSHTVALYLKKFVVEHKLATVEIVDLKTYNFPLFEEQLQFQEKPAAIFIKELLWSIKLVKNESHPSLVIRF
ncbi:NAD(P)H-dependent oxidoreductase [Flavobacterium sp. IMCC34518]|uniref:NAD(P)H-dependent oxidoreductase n=1 Tax=Flavobacterium sp. IMCC34518 TaxID=3003623 RepID=UPI0022AC48D6|nr:NAD(P)H-dependent oxidoreductase [Flavobacterium sp. IMCC34518]